LAHIVLPEGCPGHIVRVGGHQRIVERISGRVVEACEFSERLEVRQQCRQRESRLGWAVNGEPLKTGKLDTAAGPRLPVLVVIRHAINRSGAGAHQTDHNRTWRLPYGRCCGERDGSAYGVIEYLLPPA